MIECTSCPLSSFYRDYYYLISIFFFLVLVFFLTVSEVLHILTVTRTTKPIHIWVQFFKKYFFFLRYFRVRFDVKGRNKQNGNNCRFCVQCVVETSNSEWDRKNHTHTHTHTQEGFNFIIKITKRFMFCIPNTLLPVQIPFYTTEYIW